MGNTRLEARGGRKKFGAFAWGKKGPRVSHLAEEFAAVGSLDLTLWSPSLLLYKGLVVGDLMMSDVVVMDGDWEGMVVDFEVEDRSSILP